MARSSLHGGIKDGRVCRPGSLGVTAAGLTRGCAVGSAFGNGNEIRSADANCSSYRFVFIHVI